MITMGAFVEEDFCRNPKTLCDWVQNFRIKKNQMKRKLRGAAGGDLRVRAVLTLALQSAQLELQQKQQERFKRWLEMQEKYEYGAKIDTCTSKLPTKNFQSNNEIKDNEAQLIKSRQDVESLWENELSGLDQFMKSLSNKSSGMNHHHQQHQQCSVAAS